MYLLGQLVSSGHTYNDSRRIDLTSVLHRYLTPLQEWLSNHKEGNVGALREYQTYLNKLKIKTPNALVTSAHGLLVPFLVAAAFAAKEQLLTELLLETAYFAHQGHPHSGFGNHLVDLHC